MSDSVTSVYAYYICTACFLQTRLRSFADELVLAQIEPSGATLPENPLTYLH